MNVWDRQEGEPTNWYDRFERYRLLGPQRTVLRTYKAEKADRGIVENRKVVQVGSAWNEASDRWKWKERALAWDEHERSLARERHEEQLKKRREAWAVQAQALQGKAIERLMTLDAEELSVRDILAYLADGVKLELLAYGEPQEITESRNAGAEPDPKLLDEQDLVKRIRELREKAAERIAAPEAGED